MFRNKFIPTALAVAVALGGTGAAFAANGNDKDNERQEVAAVQSAKVSLTQAIAVAEQHVGGKAIESGIENRDGKIVGYEVEVARDNTVQKVLIDLDTGKVIKATKVDIDDEDGEHAEDGENEDA